MSRRVRTPLILGAWLFAGLLFAAVLARPGLAQQVPTLRDRITDQANTIKDRGRIQDALDRLEKDRGIQLWVLFVDSTGSRTATEYADAVAAANSLGGNDALLVVAMGDRSDALWVGPLLDSVSDKEIDTLLARDLEPQLKDGEFEAGVATLANGLGKAAGGDLTASGGGSGSVNVVAVLIVVGVLVALGLLVAMVAWMSVAVRRRRAAEERDRQTGEVARKANGLLLEVDEQLRAAKQELGFAEAQFSEADVKPFRDAIAGANDELRAAFTVRQQLDDDRPESPDERRKLLDTLIAHAEKARDLVGAQLARLKELRDLERTAPEQLAALPKQLDALEARMPGADAEFEALHEFAASLWTPLQGNVAEAQKRVGFARGAVAEGLAANGKPQAAVVSLRAAQAAAAEAATLLDAIDRQAQACHDARERVDTEIAAAAADVSAAQQAPKEGMAADAIEQLARATSLLETARKEAGTANPDVLAAVRAAQEANAAADAVLASVREAQARRQREEAAFSATLSRADTAYRQASDYVESRRTAMGREPRTRLAEAERRLEAARSLADTDLDRAAAEARAAEKLAGDAMNSAQRDFGGGRGPVVAGPSGSDIAGSILGGVLGGMLGGAMRGGTGFGGTPWGSMGGGRRGGGGFRLPSPGGGGGGGGGRSRGGRW